MQLVYHNYKVYKLIRLQFLLFVEFSAAALVAISGKQKLF